MNAKKSIIIILVGGLMFNCAHSKNKSGIEVDEKDIPKLEMSSISENNKEQEAVNESFVIKKTEFSIIESDALEGSSDAAFRLYQFYEFLQLDFQKSQYWLTIAAENGHSVAQYNLASILLENSDRVSMLRAKFWARKAIKSGNKEAVNLLNEIENKIKNQ